MAAMCPACDLVTPMQKAAAGQWQCGNLDCGQLLKLCQNYTSHQVCNRAIDICEEMQTQCDFCRLNRIIPALSIDGHLEQWKRLENAKRRVLYDVQRMGLPIDQGNPKLTFEFRKSDDDSATTGHEDGCITIDLNEADDTNHLRLRVGWGELQRTLVGHFRHELGHYYWNLLVKSNAERLANFRHLFGDERNPEYKDARRTFGASGPPEGLASALHLCLRFDASLGRLRGNVCRLFDMVAILTTTEHFGVTPRMNAVLDEMIASYRRIGVIANELNRDLGLLDLVPEEINTKVASKLRFVHDLRTAAVKSKVSQSAR